MYQDLVSMWYCYMGKGYEGKMRCFAYKHKKLNKHLCQLKKSLDELAEALGCGKKRCKC